MSSLPLPRARARARARASHPEPDWVCEVLSPGTAALDRGDKLTVDRTQRVPHVWLVDPEAKTLEVLELSGDRYTLRDVFTGEAACRAAPFDAFELELGLLWLR